MSSLFDLTGKVAVITGASRGIGKAIALRMAEQGARIVVSSRKLDKCQAVVAEIEARGGEAIAVQCDIAEKAQLQALADASVARFGGIDILVCNAAVSAYFGPSINMPDAAFDKVMNCNVRSNFWLCNMVLPQMQTRGGGVILVISSIGGLVGSDRNGAYNISKAADMALVRNIALEWGPRGVRANCIAPGLIRTDFSKALWDNPDYYRAAVRESPLQRIGEPDDVASAAIFLAAPGGAFTTGQTIVIDGGRLVGRVLDDHPAFAQA
jgi:NAD(P)-dependent dehydrogenase (short-subunit alcohol dehydrogenase family)